MLDRIKAARKASSHAGASVSVQQKVSRIVVCGAKPYCPLART